MTAYAPAAPNAYRESAVLTATPEQLVVMLYDGANRFLTQSAIAMREGRAGLAGEKLRRAEAIIDELLATLDMSVGDIAERLQALYLFFKDHLMAARLGQDAAKVDEVARLMRELRGAWAGIAGADPTVGPPTTALRAR
jgi:flagellar protein FliS